MAYPAKAAFWMLRSFLFSLWKIMLLEDEAR